MHIFFSFLLALHQVTLYPFIQLYFPFCYIFFFSFFRFTNIFLLIWPHAISLYTSNSPKKYREKIQKKNDRNQHVFYMWNVIFPCLLPSFFLNFKSELHFFWCSTNYVFNFFSLHLLYKKKWSATFFLLRCWHNYNWKKDPIRLTSNTKKCFSWFLYFFFSFQNSVKFKHQQWYIRIAMKSHSSCVFLIFFFVFRCKMKYIQPWMTLIG